MTPIYDHTVDMDIQIQRLLGTDDNFFVDMAMDRIRTLAIKNNLDLNELSMDLKDMGAADLVETIPRKQTTTYMLARVVLRIVLRQINASKIGERWETYYKKHQPFNELDRSDESERLEDILTREEQQKILLRYKLERLKSINISQEENTSPYAVALQILNYFTPLIFPIVEDRVWVRLERTTSLHRIPNNTNVFVQSLPLKYDENRINEWLKQIIVFLDNYFAEYKTIIQYSIQEDENYDINWIYIIMRITLLD